MRGTLILICASSLAQGAIAADEAPAPVATAQVAAHAQAASASGARAKNTGAKSEAKPDTGPKSLSGMSILGNQEAPKALVIVPWKSSQLGDPQGISKQLDDGRQPIDKDVFMRELSYYEIRTGSK
jgi:hypothetical protein